LPPKAPDELGPAGRWFVVFLPTLLPVKGLVYVVGSDWASRRERQLLACTDAKRDPLGP
jgi:hypothetical protein